MSSGSLKNKRIFVTGGGGWIGHHVVNMLLKEGAFVTVFDKNVPEENEKVAWELEEDTWEKPNFFKQIKKNDRVKIIKGDVTDFPLLESNAKGSDLFVNMAGTGYDFDTPKDVVYATNVDGASNAIKACQKNKIRFLIHTSSYSVLFSGKEEFLNGDETIKYPTKFVDNYCSTKAKGEELVLKQNTTTLPDLLLVTCIRPGTVYGPQAHNTVVPLLDAAKKGLLWSNFGHAKIPFVHVKDVAWAHVLAAAQLLAYTPGSNAPIPACAGNTFFVDDAQPRNMINYFVPLFKSLGYSTPIITLPPALGMAFAYIIAFFVLVLSLFGIRVKALLTPTQIKHATVNRYYSTANAQHILGFAPQYTPEGGLNDTIAYYVGLQKKQAEKDSKEKD